MTRTNLIELHTALSTSLSRTGKLVQIDYALNAVQQGKTSLGIKASNGVVIVTEKKLPSVLVDEKEVNKISLITPSTGFTFSGLGPDYRLLVRKARKKAQGGEFVNLRPACFSALVKDTASVMQEYTQSGGVRPFGVSVLAAGYDDEGPSLYQVDPSGAYFGWKASAIGKNYVNAKSFLEKRYMEDMELDDAVHTALLTMREGFEGEMTENNIEVGLVGADRKFKVLSPAEVRDYLDEATI